MFTHVTHANGKKCYMLVWLGKAKATSTGWVFEYKVNSKFSNALRNFQIIQSS